MNPESSTQKSEEVNDSPTNPTNPSNEQSKVKGLIKEIVIFAIIALGIVLPFRVYIAEPYLVDGRSMDPTFETGDYLIVDKISYRSEAPKRNTVVVFKYPNSPDKSFIKRIIGLPGETVIMENNKLTIINSENPNGFEIDQSYLSEENKTSADFSKTLAYDEYFVMGDNRKESFDSRSWGPLKKEFILGKPVVRLWPVTKIDLLPGQDNK